MWGERDTQHVPPSNFCSSNVGWGSWHVRDDVLLQTLLDHPSGRHVERDWLFLPSLWVCEQIAVLLQATKFWGSLLKPQWRTETSINSESSRMLCSSPKQHSRCGRFQWYKASETTGPNPQKSILMVHEAAEGLNGSRYPV